MQLKQLRYTGREQYLLGWIPIGIIQEQLTSWVVEVEESKNVLNCFEEEVILVKSVVQHWGTRLRAARDQRLAKNMRGSRRGCRVYLEGPAPLSCTLDLKDEGCPDPLCC